MLGDERHEANYSRREQNDVWPTLSSHVACKYCVGHINKRQGLEPSCKHVITREERKETSIGELLDMKYSIFERVLTINSYVYIPIVN